MKRLFHSSTKGTELTDSENLGSNFGQLTTVRLLRHVRIGNSWILRKLVNNRLGQSVVACARSRLPLRVPLDLKDHFRPLDKPHRGTTGRLRTYLLTWNLEHQTQR